MGWHFKSKLNTGPDVSSEGLEVSALERRLKSPR